MAAIALLTMMAWAAQAQVKVPGTGVTFSFPDGGWKYLQTTNVDKNTTVYLYAYGGTAVVDEMGDTVLPFLRIYVKRNYPGSVYELAYERYLQQPFQALREYDEGLVVDEALAYDGAYTSGNDTKDYRFKMLYFKVKKTAIEFRLETTTDTFGAFREMFDDILDTIEIEK